MRKFISAILTLAIASTPIFTLCIHVSADTIDIELYDKVGTGKSEFTPSSWFYYANDITKQSVFYAYEDNNMTNGYFIYHIRGLKNARVQKEINQFIDDSLNELIEKEKDAPEYIDDVKKDYSSYIECINGYAFISISARSSVITAIWDLYTGTQIEISDLFIEGSDFISNLNDSVKIALDNVFGDENLILNEARDMKNIFQQNIQIYRNFWNNPNYEMQSEMINGLEMIYPKILNYSGGENISKYSLNYMIENYFIEDIAFEEEGLNDYSSWLSMYGFNSEIDDFTDIPIFGYSYARPYFIGHKYVIINFYKEIKYGSKDPNYGSYTIYYDTVALFDLETGEKVPLDTLFIKNWYKHTYGVRYNKYDWTQETGYYPKPTLNDIEFITINNVYQGTYFGYAIIKEISTDIALDIFISFKCIDWDNLYNYYK